MLPHPLHSEPSNRYRWGCSRQNRGTAISDRLQDVADGRDARAARVLRESPLRAFDLSLTAFASKLPSDLGDLRDARGPERVSAGLQAARWVDRVRARESGLAAVEVRARFALLAEVKILH